MKVKPIESKRDGYALSVNGEKVSFSTKDILPDKVYEVIEISKTGKMYRIIDESGEDFLYHKELFEIIE